MQHRKPSPHHPRQTQHDRKKRRRVPRDLKDPHLPATNDSGSGALYFFGLGGLLFGAYVFNVGGAQTAIDSFFASLNKSAQAQNNLVQVWFVRALPVIGALLAAAVLGILYTASGLGAEKGKKKNVQVHEELSLHQFAELCRVQGVEGRVAREAYRLLLPGFRARMRTALTANLTTDLQLTSDQIRELYVALLEKTGRPEPVHGDARTFETALAMMQVVEKRPDLGLLQAKPVFEKAAATVAPAVVIPAVVASAVVAPAVVAPAVVIPAVVASAIEAAEPVVAVPAAVAAPATFLRPYRPAAASAALQDAGRAGLANVPR